MNNFSNKQLYTIIGTQYGDEGKGKFVDYISQDYDYIVRYQGGDNAGHTIVKEGKTYKLRIVPSGILNNKKVIIAHGTVLNLNTMLEELEQLSKQGINTSNLLISDGAHIIFEYHLQMDLLNEQIKGNAKIGTTLKGIGPCYADKINRIGIRVGDLLNKDILKWKIEQSLYYKNILFKQHKLSVFKAEDLAEKYYDIGQKIKNNIINSQFVINQALKNHQKVLLEGAQGLMLDIDFGTYPFVTSSSVIGLLSEGTGIAPAKFQDILGIVKAYSTRVGSGFFATEINNEKLAHEIRERGHEYGTVTKRPRRIGWLDLVVLKHAITVSGIKEIALTLIDVLSGIDQIKIATHYLLDKKKIDYIPTNLYQYEKCEPVYETLVGWKEDITNVKAKKDLPANCLKYIEFIEKYLNVKVRYISVGSDRDQTIVVEN